MENPRSILTFEGGKYEKGSECHFFYWIEYLIRQDSGNLGSGCYFLLKMYLKPTDNVFVISISFKTSIIGLYSTDCIPVVIIIHREL